MWNLTGFHLNFKDRHKNGYLKNDFDNTDLHTSQERCRSKHNSHPPKGFSKTYDRTHDRK